MPPPNLDLMQGVRRKDSDEVYCQPGILSGVPPLFLTFEARTRTVPVEGIPQRKCLQEMK